MRKPSEKKAEMLAYSLLGRYEIKSPIRDMDAVVRELGGTLEKGSGLDEVTHDIAVKKTGEDSFSIFISPRVLRQDRNMKIAMALGFVFLCMGFRTSPKKWDSEEVGQYKLLAERDFCENIKVFALTFIMPEKLFNKITKMNTKNDAIVLSKVADAFEVSVTDAFQRIIDLETR